MSSTCMAMAGSDGSVGQFLIRSTSCWFIAKPQPGTQRFRKTYRRVRMPG
jgi:hypothetical protein